MTGAEIGTLGMGALGMVADQLGAGQSYKRQKNLMGLQKSNQMELNQQGHDLSYAMWEKTNYDAQMRQMEKAGLNVGLMYGGGGAGGGTASTGSGGSASGGNAPSTNMGGMAMQMGLMAAQKENIEADTELKKVDANKKSGADTANVEANTALTNLKSENERVLLTVNTQTIETAIGTIEANYKKAEGEASTAIAEGRMSAERVNLELIKLKQEGINASLQAGAIKAGIKLTAEQTRKIGEEIAQGWEGLYQTARSNDNAEGQVNIAGFNAKVNEMLGKANVDLRAKELMVKGAGEFIKGITGGKKIEQNGERKTTVNNY